MSRQFFCFLFFSLSILIVQNAHAQCCSPGNPVGGISAMGTLPAGAFKFFLHHKYGYSGKYFEGNRRVSSAFITHGRYHFSGVNAAYGISDRVMMDVETGYVLDKSQFYADGIIPERFTGTGLTDLALGIRAAVYKNKTRGLELTTGLGIKFPLGPNTQMYRGALVPLDLQPSSGSIDYFHTLFLYKEIPEKHLRFFIVNRIEFKRKNKEEYRYGNMYATSFFISYSASKKWIFLVQCRSEIRERDERNFTGEGISVSATRELVIPTGSEKVFVVPQVSYEIARDWNATLLVDVPVYQFYKGKQLANNYAVNVGLSKQF